MGVLKSQVTTSREESELVPQTKSQGLGKVDPRDLGKLAEICTSPRGGYEESMNFTGNPLWTDQSFCLSNRGTLDQQWALM